MLSVEAANGLVDIGDRVAFPGPKGQRLGVVDKIVAVRSFSGFPAASGTAYRIHVHFDGQPRWSPGSVIRNPKNIVVLPPASEGA